MVGSRTKGYALITVLVALALLGIVIQSAMAMLTHSLKGSRHVAQATSFQMLRSELRTFLSNPDVCYQTFRGVIFGATQSISIKSVDGSQTLLTAGQKREGLEVQSLQADVPAPGSSKVSLVTLTIEAKKIGFRFGAETKEETFFVNLLTDGTSVLRCVYDEDPTAIKWLNAETNWLPQSSNTYTTSGTYAAGFYDYTAKGNALWVELFWYARAVRIGPTGHATAQMEFIDITVEPDLVIHSPNWGRVQGDDEKTDELFNWSRLYRSIIPGHTYRLNFKIDVVIPSPDATKWVKTSGNIRMSIFDLVKP